MRKLLTILAVIALIAVVGGSAVRYFGTHNLGESNLGQQGRGGDNGEGPNGPGQPEGPAQPDWCPRVEVVSAPGTWESAKDDDPLNPTANPRSFMLSVSNPLRQAYAPEDVKVWTLPYTAQFKNVNAQHEMTYDDSRDEGTARLREELKFMHDNCPATKFVLTGFSQGAVIVGDVADKIGGGEGVIPAEAVAGVALVADGRRQNGVGINPGTKLGGVGAEIALEPVSGLVQPVVPGATMRGPREHGFGSLADRTYQICAPNDSICDAPVNIVNGFDRAMGLIEANGVHAQYASNPQVVSGTTANQWLVGWARQTIDAVQ